MRASSLGADRTETRHVASAPTCLGISRHVRRAVSALARIIICGVLLGLAVTEAAAAPTRFQLRGSVATCDKTLELAAVGDTSLSMEQRARLPLGRTELDTLSAVVAACGGRMLFVLVGAFPADRLRSVTFEQRVIAKHVPVETTDTLGQPFKAKAVLRRVAEEDRLAQIAQASVATRNEARRRAFLRGVEELISKGRDSAAGSQVCQSLRDVNDFFGLKGPGPIGAVRLLYIGSDLEATDSGRCPRLTVDAVIIAADQAVRPAISLGPTTRVHSFDDVLLRILPSITGVRQ